LGIVHQNGFSSQPYLSLDVRQWPAGIYYLQMQGAGKIAAVKLIKK
jgi:hypothetical protein